jgi:hypothetical protein
LEESTARKPTIFTHEQQRTRVHTHTQSKKGNNVERERKMMEEKVSGENNVGQKKS